MNRLPPTFCALLILLPSAAAALSEIVLTSEAHEYAIRPDPTDTTARPDQQECLEEKGEERFGIDEVAGKYAAAFTSPCDQIPGFGRNESAWWMRFKLNPRRRDEPRVAPAYESHPDLHTSGTGEVRHHSGSEPGE